MDPRRIRPFDCFIHCSTKHEAKEILNDLKTFEGYKFRWEEEMIDTIFATSDNEDSTSVESDDGKMVPQQYLDLHEFLVERGFVMTRSGLGQPMYEKLPDRYRFELHDNQRHRR
ncbi:hypothetical protein J3E69DRAFT_375843 [Trichoderma sp. SZMC 28015]